MVAKFNWLILAAVLILFIISSALIFSLASELFANHLFYIFLSLAVFYFISRIDYQIFFRFHWLIFLIALGALFSTFFIGRLTRGTLRWVKLGPITLQPSELVKPMLILVFASFVVSKKWSFKELILSFLLLLLPAFLIFQQPDLGSCFVIVTVWLLMTIFKVDKKQALFLFFLFILGSGAGWLLLKAYQKERIVAFLNPYEDPLGRGYHLIQATIAAGSGKFFGRGLFRGTQSQLEFLPERHSDFIFASLAEELGFIGSFGLLAVYFILLVQILKIADRTRDEFGLLICVGVFALFFIQILINVGMNLGLLPITGVTLPLISSGGSSLVAFMACLGLVESVVKKTRTTQSLEIR